MIVALLQSDQSVNQVSSEYNLNGSMIRKWRKFHESNAGVFTEKSFIRRSAFVLKK